MPPSNRVTTRVAPRFSPGWATCQARNANRTVNRPGYFSPCKPGVPARNRMHVPKGRRSADTLGVTQTTVQRWENGHRSPRGHNATRYYRLLDALLYDLGWIDDAACRQPVHDDGGIVDPAIVHGWFYSDNDGRKHAQVERARAICTGCQVRVACQQYAIAAQEPAGIWGGLTTRERARAMNTRRRKDTT